MNDDMNFNIEDNEVEVLEYEKSNLEENNVSINNKKKDKDKDYKFIKMGIILLSIFIIIIASIGYFKKSDNVLYKNSKYIVSDFNTSTHEYKLLKSSSIDDSIILRNVTDNSDVQYTFQIYNNKVQIISGDAKYTIKKIENANRLVVTLVGSSNENTGAFILTTDGKVYSINLYDRGSNLITNIGELEDSINEYKFDSQIRDISSGVYTEKISGFNEMGIRAIDVNNKKYMLTAKNKKK